MSSILTNNSAMVALDTLRGINKNLEGVQSEISTGKKIATSTDNAAIWSISTVMESDVKSFDQVSDSLNLGSATVGVARSGAEAITERLQEAKALIVAANDPSVSDSDREKYQTDITELTASVQSIVDSASSNGQNLLKGGGSIDVLSSLNRQSDGTVQAGKVNVERQNLSTAAAVAGTEVTGAVNTAVASGPGAVSTDAVTVTANDGTNDGTGTFTITQGAIAEDTTFSLTVGGTTVTADIAAGTSAEDASTAFAAAITSEFGGSGLSAAATTAGDSTITFTNTALTAVDVSGITSFTTEPGEAGSVDSAAVAITANDGSGTDGTGTLTIAEGSLEADTLYSLSFGDDTVTYSAAKGDTAEDAGAGFAAALNDYFAGNVAGTTPPAGLSVAATTSGDTTLTFTNTDTNSVDATGASAANNAEAEGGLYALSQIDVGTIAGAEAGLEAIDSLLQSAIDATAQFGSKQKRIDDQNEFVTTLKDSLKTGIGAMTDANLEEASARLQSLQVQQQLGVQALSIANQGPQQLLSLFR